PRAPGSASRRGGADQRRVGCSSSWERLQLRCGSLLPVQTARRCRRRMRGAFCADAASSVGSRSRRVRIAGIGGTPNIATPVTHDPALRATFSLAGRREGALKEERCMARKSRLPEQAIELEILDLSHDGRGVARIDNKTVFVPYALLGERIMARLV